MSDEMRDFGVQAEGTTPRQIARAQVTAFRLDRRGHDLATHEQLLAEAQILALIDVAESIDRLSEDIRTALQELSAATRRGST